MGRVAYSPGARIRAERTRRGWSMRHLASRTGLHEQALWRIETERQEARASEIAAIATALGMSQGDLLGDPPPSEEPAAS